MDGVQERYQYCYMLGIYDHQAIYYFQTTSWQFHYQETFEKVLAELIQFDDSFQVLVSCIIVNY